MIDDTYGPRAVKLPAGHMVLYPGTSLHKVNPVTRGARVSSFFWMQSLVREDSQRAAAGHGRGHTAPEPGRRGHPSIVQLTGIYHNLLRRWVDV